MPLRPMGDRVLVKQQEASEAMTKGGLHIPDTAKARPSRGEVIAAGPGRTTDEGNLVPMQLRVGDIVLFGKYSGVTVEDPDHGDLMFMREADVLAVDEVEL